jgi:hypothetical protein
MERMRLLALFFIVLLQQNFPPTMALFEERLNLTFRIKAVFRGNGGNGVRKEGDHLSRFLAD